MLRVGYFAFIEFNELHDFSSKIPKTFIYKVQQPVDHKKQTSGLQLLSYSLFKYFHFIRDNVVDLN